MLLEIIDSIIPRRIIVVSFFLILFGSIFPMFVIDVYGESFFVDIPPGASSPSCPSTTNACYNPEFISVTKGDSITWINKDGTSHTTTSGSSGDLTGLWDSGTIPNGGSFKLDTLQIPEGQHDYFCTIHPWMEGIIQVISAVNQDPIIPKIPKGDITIDLLTVATDLISPVHLTHAGDDRLFVVDQPGEIRVISENQLLAIPFLDIKSEIIDLGFFGTQDENDFDERGLLGLAFHPDYSNIEMPGYGKFYTYSSEPVSGAADFPVVESDDNNDGIIDPINHESVIREWTVSDPLVNVFSGVSRVLMRVEQPQFNHNGGMLDFGPDKMLYVSFGDGGSSNDFADGHGLDGNGQNNTNVLGSILRIDPLGNNSSNGQYGIPFDNPFVDVTGEDEIYSFGLRNPWRFSFDSQTGYLIVADVGQNKIEEINVVNSGDNLGWRLKEGTFAFDHITGTISDDLSGLPPGLVDPVAQYDHDEGISITGGYVYRGSAISQLMGLYVFGDFSSGFSIPDGRIFYADLITGEIEEFTIADGDLPLNTYVKSTGIDNQGELYFLVGTNLGPFETSQGQRLGQVLKLISPPSICDVPDFGDMIVTEDCSISESNVAPRNVIVQNGAKMTILKGVSFDIDFSNFNLIVKSGSAVIVKAGGSIS